MGRNINIAQTEITRHCFKLASFFTLIRYTVCFRSERSGAAPGAVQYACGRCVRCGLVHFTGLGQTADIRRRCHPKHRCQSSHRYAAYSRCLRHVQRLRPGLTSTFSASLSSVARRWLKQRFYLDSIAIRSPFDSHSTAIGPRYDRLSTYVTVVRLPVCELLHSCRNKNRSA